MDFQSIAQQYHAELLDRIIPFWEYKSIDKEHGGFYTCLDRQGNVFDTDKFIWLQARQVFMFAKLYLEVEKRDSWLEIAENGAKFLMDYGRDEEGDWYFSLEESGTPLVNSYNIFSDCFAAMAFGTLYKAKPKDAYKNIASKTFQRILARQDNPKKAFNKAHPRGRKSQNFGLPMIICNLAQELDHIIESDLAESLTKTIQEKLMHTFYDKDQDIIRENVSLDGEFMDTFEGRLINPGHAIEAMWFMMDQAYANGDIPLVKEALRRGIKMIEYGWDHEHGGIFYFMDSEGHPPQQLEWDQKLWWVHLEALICLAKGIHYLDDDECKSWFEKIHHYTWEHFRDPEYGEWYGYLNRRGEVLLPLKGGKWKGCFHVPRAMLSIWKSLEAS
jgi:N-acylglucosamine 2-epimerase